MDNFRKAKKTKQAIQFIEGLEKYVTHHKWLPKKIGSKSESAIQGQLLSFFREYLEDYYLSKGFSAELSQDRAAKYLYWEGDYRSRKGPKKKDIFGSRNYPDFEYSHPYSLAIEYKQGSSGSLMKQGIGQSMVHILNGEYSFVYFLFNDQSNGKKIKSSMRRKKEAAVRAMLWQKFNIYIHVV